MEKSTYRLVTIALITLMFLSCEQSSQHLNGPSESKVSEVKFSEMKSHMEGVLKAVIEVAPRILPELREKLRQGPATIDEFHAFESIDPYVTVLETGWKYRILLSRFSESIQDDWSSVVFSLDPDRFRSKEGLLTGHAVLAGSELAKVGVANSGAMMEVGQVRAGKAIPYVLIFIDIERVIDTEETVAIWDELIRESTNYKERGIKDVRSALCMECEEGGGGGGGNPPAPKPWLVLHYIMLKTDMDDGDDECELYIREDSGDPATPGGWVKRRTGHRFSGDVWPDAALRQRWFPNLNNAGDALGGLDIALWPLSDQYPVSVVGIEDDWDETYHDWDDNTPRPIDMFWEYRRDLDDFVELQRRNFDIEHRWWGWIDADDVWRTSHIANFTASNMNEGEVVTINTGDFVFQVVKKTF